MSKPKRERTLPDNEAKAVARMLRVSPQKLNLVAQLIRGRKASAALADLQFSRKRIAVDVKKCLESAIANAENNHDLEVDDLVVAEAHVGKALVLKRFSPRARPAVTTSSRSGAAARPSCRSSSVWCSASTTARSMCRYRSTRKWSGTSSASSRRPGPSTAIPATRKPRRPDVRL